LATAIEVGYVIRWNVKLWFGEETQEDKTPAPFTVGLFAMILAAFLVFVFVKPEVALSGTQKMAEALIDTEGYIKGVLFSTRGGM